MSITGTLIVQMIVFLILVGFTMKFVWPPIANALDERAEKISSGLAAAENAKIELSMAQKHVETERSKTRNEATLLLADAKRRAQALIDEAKAQAVVEANKIISQAKADTQQQVVKARETLREQVAVLAVKGAEQILRKEVNASVHADLLGRLKTEL
ncbi:MAG: F0F1 ATP synthase subunit B [Limnohabitans sp.]|nr:F0F1 ATP synthase subunit B [Limnohabitans sp.]